MSPSRRFPLQGAGGALSYPQHLERPAEAGPATWEADFQGASRLGEDVAPTGNQTSDRGRWVSSVVRTPRARGLLRSRGSAPRASAA